VPEEALMESVDSSGCSPDANDIEKAEWIKAVAIQDTNLKKGGG
jgi:hypothetical protein